MFKYLIFFLPAFLLLFSCSEKKPVSAEKPYSETHQNYPEWITRYSLSYPDAAWLPGGEKAVFKTYQPVKDIENYYLEKMKSNGFSLLTSLDMSGSKLLQFRKKGETISIEIKDIVYSSNHLILLGYSKVDYGATND